MYVADFETTTVLDDCRVWAWAVAPFESDEMEYGTDIESFIEFCENHPDTYYFHNLAFDGEFILHYVLSHGWTYSDKAAPHTFKTLISQTGKFYQLELCFSGSRNRKKKACIYKDSMKKLPMSVKSVAKAFEFELQKGEIDYEAPRPKGHMLTNEELSYIHNDVFIIRDALDVQFSQGLDKLTIGADALGYFKLSTPAFGELFPSMTVEIDDHLRKAYRGGWTYANPLFQATEDYPTKSVGEGSVYDVNSLYPSVMYENPFPVGEPVPFSGEYKYDKDYPLYIQFISCVFNVKPNHLPMLQVKNSPYFNPRFYYTQSPGIVELALTNVDMELMLDQYDVDILAYNGGYKFQERRGLFKHYIEKWMDVKEHSEGGIRKLAKLMLNSLYGKFGTNPDVTPKIPYLREDGSVGYRLGEREFRKPIYVPLACFVTAYARDVTVRAAQANYDRFLYADTDSLHLLGREEPDLPIHHSHLGMWAHESNFSKGRYIRAKTYAEVITQKPDKSNPDELVDCEPFLDVKCAGLPSNCKDQVTWENFKLGLIVRGKLMPAHVKGGIVLMPHDFQIR